MLRPCISPHSGDSYKLGTKGLIAWAGLVLVLLGVGVNLVISTSALGEAWAWVIGAL